MRKKVMVSVMAVAIAAVFAIQVVGQCGKTGGCPKTKKCAEQPQENKWAFLPEIVATVGNQTITREQFIKDVEAQLTATGVPQQAINAKMLKQASGKIAASMVDKMVLLRLAEASGVKPGPEMVAAQLDKMIKSMPPKQLEAFKKQLSQQKTSLEQYREKLCSNKQAQEGMAIDKYVAENIASKATVDDAAVEAFYKDHPKQFTVPETVEAAHILIRPAADTDEARNSAKTKAEELLAKIKSGGETFEVIAERESACPSGKRAKGSLGRFARGQMVKEFETAVFNLKPGEMSEVVETPFGYHIVRVDKAHESSVVPYDKVKGMIRNRLTGQKVMEALQQAIAAERTKLNVKINV